MQILVTGATGFAGSWLVEALLAWRQGTIHGLCRSGTWPDYCSHLREQATLHGCDLTDTHNSQKFLSRCSLRRFIIWQGMPRLDDLSKNRELAWQGNFEATRCLLDAVSQWGGQARILSVSSGMIYGSPSRADLLVTEESPMQPCNPYCTSKCAADLLGYQYTRSHGLDIVRARPFNHIGPRQSPEFALASFSKQLAEISLGKRAPVLEIGDLSTHRDMTDVRDVCDAYIQLMAHGETGEAYNVASGETRTIQSLLDALVELTGVKVELRQRADLLRVTDTSKMIVSIEKLRQTTGWKPKHQLMTTLQDLLSYWRDAT